MIPYDEIIDRTVRWSQRQPWFEKCASAVLVRDLLGRVRLVVDGSVPDGAESLLIKELDGWAGGLISTTGRPDEVTIARRIIDEAEPWPTRWAKQVSDGFGGYVPVDGRWRSLERVSGKESWLVGSKALTPWPLLAQTPAIATFYSFKGGVGRTTALAITAATLAAAGQRVLAST